MKEGHSDKKEEPLFSTQVMYPNHVNMEAHHVESMEPPMKVE